ncbi:primosome assembly protein PriA [compost metagenome]
MEFYNTEIEHRKLFEYPPFMDIVLIELSGEYLKNVKKDADTMYEILNKNNNIYKVFSPRSPYIQKINNKYKINIIIKCKLSKIFFKTFYEKINEYEKIKGKNISTIITKNPIFIG